MADIAGKRTADGRHMDTGFCQAAILYLLLFFCLFCVFLDEFIYPTFGVNKFLFTRKKRMAFRADIHVYGLFG
jgi:hypothetical protein